jgi:uncharacterized protein (DUF1697 family)
MARAAGREGGAPRYVAFLRAINVGGRTVKMDRLRAIFEAQGLASVSTFIASGNVLFDTRARDLSALELRIERALRDALGYDAETFVRSLRELVDVVAHDPFPERAAGDGYARSVAFVRAPPDGATQARVLALRNDVDDLAIRGREVYWLRRGPFSATRLAGGALERALGMPATVRNVTTVRKLAARCSPG